MISVILLAAALQCPNTKFVNVSGYEWNQHDLNTYRYVQKRCVQVYPDSPCVKLFRKWGKQDYSVICGAKDGKPFEGS